MTERPPPLKLCGRHGEFEGFWAGDIARGPCPKCEAEREQAQKREAEQAEISRFIDLMHRSQIPPLFQKATFDNYVTTTAEQSAALAACREYADGVELRQWGAPWLIGTVGTGKTHLACATAAAFMRKLKASAIYATPRSITRALRSTWRRDSDVSEDQVLDLFSGAGLLILDEVGANVGSESETAQLSELVDLRYGHGLPVMVVSNLPAKELRGVLGERAYDRLRQGAKVITCTWPSYRGTI